LKAYIKILGLLASHLITIRAISTYDSPSPIYENLRLLRLNHSPSDRPWNIITNGDTLPILRINSSLQALSDF